MACGQGGQNLALEPADGEAVAVLEQDVELGTFARDVDRVEDRPEDLLHLLDALADRHPGAGLDLEIGRAGEVVGMNMGLEDEGNGEPLLLGLGEDGIGRGDVGLAGLVIIVEDRIDDRCLTRFGIADKIAHRVGGRVEEGVDDGFRHDRHLLGHEFP